jgi:hypothetical protein
MSPQRICVSLHQRHQAYIFVSWLHPFKVQKLVVVGDGGMAVFDDGEAWAEKLLFYPHRVAWRDGVPQPTRADATPVAMQPACEIVETGNESWRFKNRA